jgi:WD40 repeat protein/serine/threonine protein kinase
MQNTPDDLEGPTQLRELCAELRRRLRAGESDSAVQLLATHPKLAAKVEAILGLLHGEAATRDEPDQELSLADWHQRFPHLCERLERLFNRREDSSQELSTLHDDKLAGGRPGGSLAFSDARGRQIGAYQIIDEIGRGGMGVVYKARQTTLCRIVALKMILSGEHAGARERTRLRIEAEAAAQLFHPNVVQIFEIGEHDGLPFLALEYVGGGSLARVLGGRPQAFRWSSHLIETLARAIHIAHQKGIVHRDLNPSNILLTPDGVPKISDFGLAKFIRAQSGVSQNGLMLGTPPYMAPEQVSGQGQQVGPATDIYALGTILYLLLTGVAPFRGLTAMETLCQVMEAEVVPPSRLRLEMPRDLETICLKCLEREPAQRYSSAQELAEDLERFQAHRPILARPSPVWKRAVQWIRRQPLVAALTGLTAALTVALLLVIASYTFYLQQNNLSLQASIALSHRHEHELAMNRERVDRQERLARRQLYSSQINLVHESFKVGQIELAQDLLERLRRQLLPDGKTGFEWLYLDALLRHRVTLLFGGEASVSCLAVSRDGRILVTGDRGGSLMFWDLAERRGRVSHNGGESTICLAVITPDGQTAVSAGMGQSDAAHPFAEIKVWDVAAARATATMRVELTAIWGLWLSPDGRTLNCWGPSQYQPAGESRFWRRDGTNWRAERGRTLGAVPRQAFSADGRLLAMGRIDGSILLSDPCDDRPPRELASGGPGIESLAFSPDGSRLAAGRQDCSLTIWELPSGHILSRTACGNAPITLLAFGLDGQTLITREGNRTLALRRLDSVATRIVLEGLEGTASYVAVSPDGRKLAAAGWDQQATLWDLTSGRLCELYPGHIDFLNNLLFTPDSKAVVLSGDDPRVRIWWAASSQNPRRSLTGHPVEAWAVAFSPDSKILASGSDDKTIKLWNIETDQLMATLKGYGATVTSVAFSPSGDRLASASLDGTVRVWSLRKAGDSISAESTVLRGHTDRVRSVAFAPDGRTLASAGSDRTVRIWEVATGRLLTTLTGPTDILHTVAYSPDGQTLAAGGNDQVLRLWDVATGLPRMAPPSKGQITSLAFSRDGALLAVSTTGRTVTLWNVATGQLQTTLAGHAQSVRAAVFSPDGSLVATGCDDAKVRLWDAQTSQLLFTFDRHRARVNAVAFSPDGRVLASGSHDGVVRLWDGRTGFPPRGDP